LVSKIFVGGLPRSGTTMVQNILDSHPVIYGGPEFDRIPNIMDLRNKLQNTLESGRISTYTDSKEIDTAIANLINALFSNIDSPKNLSFISEKTPWNILFFEELFQVFPDAHFMMVLRNPLDVFSSMKKVAQRAKKKGIQPPDFTTNFKTAVAYMEAVYDIMERLRFEHPERFLLVRYEDLLDNLEEETRRICTYLKIEWSEKMMAFNEMEHPGEKTMTANDIWYSKSSFNANPKEVKKMAKTPSLTYIEKTFITYMFRKNTFVNSDQRYLQEPNLIEKIVGRLILNDYTSNYRFQKSPKRILG